MYTLWSSCWKARNYIITRLMYVWCVLARNQCSRKSQRPSKSCYYNIGNGNGSDSSYCRIDRSVVFDSCVPVCMAIGPTRRKSAVCTTNDISMGSAVLLGLLVWLGSRVVSVLDSGAEGLGFKSQSRRCRVTALGKLFTPSVPLFTKQRNW